MSRRFTEAEIAEVWERRKAGWNEANQEHSFELRLLTEDGEPVKNDTGDDILLGADFEVRRPPGVKRRLPAGDTGAHSRRRAGPKGMS